MVLFEDLFQWLVDMDIDFLTIQSSECFGGFAPETLPPLAVAVKKVPTWNPH
jgi:hypothetical protein